MLVSCKVRRPNTIIPEAQMEELLYDYHLAKAMGDNLPYNESYKKVLYLEYVFKKHTTTEAQFDSSMVWYTRHADVLSKMYERINKKLTAEQEEINRLVAIRDNKPKTSTPGDSIDVWLLERMFRITGKPLNNRVAFTLPSDSNFHARDTIRWNVRYHFLDSKPDSTQAAIMSMKIQYTNDSIIGYTKRILQSGMESISLQADTLGEIKEVQGFIYYTGGKWAERHLLIDSVTLMRYHSTDSLYIEKADSLALDNEKEPLKEESKKEEKPEVKEPASSQPERVSPEEMKLRRNERRAPTQRAVELENPEERGGQ